MINISMDGVLARKNGKKDCYYEWTVGCSQVKVGKCSMEVKGLEELFHDYFEKGMTAEEIEGREMIREVRRQNFIPDDIEDLYEEALIRSTKDILNPGRSKCLMVNAACKQKRSCLILVFGRNKVRTDMCR